MSWQELWYCRIRFIHKGGMLVGVKAFYEKRRCMMVDRQVVAVEVLECSDERVSGEEMRSSDYKLSIFRGWIRLKNRGENSQWTMNELGDSV